MFAVHRTTAMKSFSLVNLCTTNGIIFGPSATRAANSGPIARVFEFGESLLLNHIFFQASYLVLKSSARAGDVVFSLLYRSLADFTAAALGGWMGVRGSMSAPLRKSWVKMMRTLGTETKTEVGKKSSRWMAGNLEGNKRRLTVDLAGQNFQLVTQRFAR